MPREEERRERLLGMLIVGERINTSLKGISPAVEAKDVSFIQDLAKKQVEAGTSFIDVNAGTLVSGEPQALEWLVRTVQEAVDVPLCIDSPNPTAIEIALKVHKGKAMVSSITAERDRFDSILSLVKKYNSSVVALCMDDRGIPETAEERCQIASKILDDLTKAGVPRDDIYFDPMVRPVSVDARFGMVALSTISWIMSNLKGVHTICGVSNISFGLPLRRLVNRAFLVMAMGVGMDAAILDPLDEVTMSLVQAGRTILGNDDFCVNYISAYRGGALKA